MIVTFDPATRAGEVDPEPPFATGSGVPEYEIAKVPEVVIGDPEIDRNVGTVAATLVTREVQAQPTVECTTDPIIFGNGAQFQLNGDYIAGPAPRSLDRFQFQVQDASGAVIAAS